MHARLRQSPKIKNDSYFDKRMELFNEGISGTRDNIQGGREYEHAIHYYPNSVKISNETIKKEKAVIGKLLKGPPPSRYQKQLGIAGISTPEIMKEKI